MDKMNNETLSNPIIISKDNYVIDGHHRWLAHLNKNKIIDVLKIDLNAKDLIDKIHDYDKSYTKKLNETK